MVVDSNTRFSADLEDTDKWKKHSSTGPSMQQKLNNNSNDNDKVSNRFPTQAPVESLKKLNLGH